MLFANHLSKKCIHKIDSLYPGLGHAVLCRFAFSYIMSKFRILELSQSVKFNKCNK